MQIGPISRALWRNKASAALIIAQIALTLAVVINALFIISESIDKMARPVGIDVDNSFSLNTGMLADGDYSSFIRQDMEAIRAIPGVLGATSIINYLQSGSARIEGYRSTPDPDGSEELMVNLNYADELGQQAYGVELLAGRWFTADEVRTIDDNDEAAATVAIVTETLAWKYFPEGDALGKRLYVGDDELHELEIIGIINDVATGWIASEASYATDSYYNFMLHPYRLYGSSANYLVRAEPGAREKLIPLVEKALRDNNAQRLVENIQTQTEILQDTYQDDRATMIVLMVVIGLMVLITGLGIVGLVSFQVSQRTRQIGVRRALGATRGAIVRHFVLENLILSSIGIVVGTGLTYLLNYYVTSQLGGKHLDPTIVPLGIAAIYLLGILAVMLPAVRASRILPAVATRAV